MRAGADRSDPGADPLTVTVNGAPVRMPRGATVADVVDRLAPGGRGVAVAIGREVVPRSAWGAVTLEEGSVLEVVTAAAGG